MQLLFVTSNKNKVYEIERVLGFAVEQAKIELPEIQSVDVRSVIEAKVKSAYEKVGRTILVEDTGLSFAAWNGLPGALIAWFLKSVGTEGICAMLDGFDSRRAIAETWIGYYDGERFELFSGKIEGSIAEEPRGTMGFGWDSIFIPEGSTKTFAELTAEQKTSFSMRTEAVHQLKAFLEKDIAL